MGTRFSLCVHDYLALSAAIQIAQCHLGRKHLRVGVSKEKNKGMACLSHLIKDTAVHDLFSNGFTSKAKEIHPRLPIIALN